MIQTEMEYVGPVKELQGKTAQVRSPSREEDSKPLAPYPIGTVMAQFGTKRWIPVPLVDFRPITGKPVF